ncbi:MAG: hypothetical protein WC900_10530 [Oscillospiraceae bacterium]
MKVKELLKKYWIAPCLIIVVLFFVVKVSFFNKNDNWIDKEKLFKGFEKVSENEFKTGIVFLFRINEKEKSITIHTLYSNITENNNIEPDYLLLDKFFKRLLPGWNGARETVMGRIPMLMRKANWQFAMSVPYNEYYIGVYPYPEGMITIEKNRKMAR